jgi:very-short-patch-repair endonuclease
MNAQGIEVLRFAGRKVEEEIQSVLGAIDEALRQRCPESKPK